MVSVDVKHHVYLLLSAKLEDGATEVGGGGGGEEGGGGGCDEESGGKCQASLASVSPD